MRLRLSLTALALAAAPGAGQLGNGSDVTGPGLTNGGIAGGTYEAGGFRRSENAVFRTPNGTTVWANGAVACAVTGAIPAAERALRDGPLQARPEAGGRPLDDDARAALWGVMRADSVDRTAAAAALEAQLRAGVAAESRAGRRAGELVDALAGLLGKGAACPPGDRLIVARAWADAVRAYDRFLDARGRAPASDALLGVHAVLMPLMEAAVAAAGAERA